MAKNTTFCLIQQLKELRFESQRLIYRSHQLCDRAEKLVAAAREITSSSISGSISRQEHRAGSVSRQS